jgi:Short C-terminal domain
MRRTRSLLGTAARTAVITGTAKTVMGGGRRGAPPAAAPAGAAPVTEAEKLANLEKLGKLHRDGVLTAEEFAAEKALILRS